TPGSRTGGSVVPWSRSYAGWGSALDSGEERVGGQLAGHRRGRTVPGHEQRVVRQPRGEVAQGRGHPSLVSSGQVGAADGTGEQDVAGEHHRAAVVADPRLGEDRADELVAAGELEQGAARGVPGCGDRLEDEA